MIPVTAEGKRKLQEELERIEARIPLVRKAIEEAREKGDLKENAEYHAAREELGHLQARRSEVGGKLTQAVVVNESLIDRDSVAFGARVTLKDLSDRSSEEWTLVGEGEDDPLENKILTTSPMGQALIGRKLGDTIEVAAPMGKLRFTITKLAYDG